MDRSTPNLPIASSVSGYKDFKWGEDAKSVRKRIPNFDEKYVVLGSEGPDLTAPYFYETDFRRDPIYSLHLLEGRFSSYWGILEPTFYFLDRKLVAVEIRPGGATIVDDLESKHGYVPSKSYESFGERREIKAWFNDPGRIIVYEKVSRDKPADPQSSITFTSAESVIYLDPDLYKRACAECEKERIRKDKEPKYGIEWVIMKL